MNTLTEEEYRELLEIAKRCFHAIEKRDSLAEFGSDDEDFIEVSVWSLEAALKQAYFLGKAKK